MINWTAMLVLSALPLLGGMALMRRGHINHPVGSETRLSLMTLGCSFITAGLILAGISLLAIT